MRRPKLTAVALFLFAGAAANVAVAVGLTLWVDLNQPRTTQTAQAGTTAGVWIVTRTTAPGGMRLVSTHEVGRNWSPHQAAGAPDALSGGDNPQAWASASQDGQPEWLILDYQTAVLPKAVKIYETCATGAVNKVTAFKADGTEVVGWEGVDPLPKRQPVGVADIPLTINFPTKRVKVYIDSPSVPSWNEIDAVGLVDAAGAGDRIQWAVAVEASSVYGSGSGGGVPPTGGGPAALAPAWARLHPPVAARPAGRVVKREERIVEARGWPLLALSGERDVTAAAAAASVYTRTTSVTGFRALGGVAAGGAGGPGDPILPLRPIWSGFAINTLVYALVLAGLYWVLAVPRRFVRESSRMRHGHCVACGYDIGYDFLRGCPECGWNRRSEAAARAPTPEGVRASDGNGSSPPHPSPVARS